MDWNAVNPLRIVILDDHEVVLRGLVSCLSAEIDLRVVGSFTRVPDLLVELARGSTDLAVIDFSLGGDQMDGLNLIQVLQRKHPSLPLVMLSSHFDVATVDLAMRAGIRGYVGKTEGLAALVNAVRIVASGRLYFSPQIAEALPLGKTAARPEIPGPNSSLLTSMASLSPKEREVVRCALEGMSVKQIAEKFSRSNKTISAQKQSAYRKLGITTDNELFRIGALWGDI
ncbi:LuxR family transcriptional regulator [Pandoraea iniqua]|uniref:LuxR family transcriptional regulator n=1 Tax=Pandoraea iniqua TaxID=2508288 RepID=A0A5E4SX59_9BURK|nr:response regulator transcription factor [Pandoraea iniqua]VVD79622.1 LuxR family transcriptional regulator [Pandoraea iniqua]